MTPNVDERLASIVRSLTEVVLPHLPAEASLAQEQVQMCIGHIQVLRKQLDEIPAFEAGELTDACALARALSGGIGGGAQTGAAKAALVGATIRADGTQVRRQTLEIHKSVDALVKAVACDGDAESRKSISRLILEHEAARALKDRTWFAPYGFDTL